MEGILLSAYIENITTRKDKSVKVTLGTQELSQGKAGELFTLLNNLALVYISQKDITESEKERINNIEPDLETKSQSQRMRSVLFILWKQNNEGHQTFDAYYRAKMEVFIEHLKSKINDAPF